MVQPCWVCKNSIGVCSWSYNFTPVEGWKAKPTKIVVNGKYEDSYKIIECPQFKYDGLCTKCDYCPPSKRDDAFYSDKCKMFVGCGSTACERFTHT